MLVVNIGHDIVRYQPLVLLLFLLFNLTLRLILLLLLLLYYYCCYCYHYHYHFHFHFHFHYNFYSKKKKRKKNTNKPTYSCFQFFLKLVLKLGELAWWMPNFVFLIKKKKKKKSVTFGGCLLNFFPISTFFEFSFVLKVFIAWELPRENLRIFFYRVTKLKL
jgi:hypothetical protein